MIASKDTFEDVIFTDECSVQLDRHGKLCLNQNPSTPLKFMFGVALACMVPLHLSYSQEL